MNRILAVIIGVLVGLALVMCVARAHDPYTGIFNFDGVNCCTGDDCKAAADPKDFLPLPGGAYQLRSTGEKVHPGETGFSPDANWHVCRKANKEKSIRCLLVPAGGA